MTVSAAAPMDLALVTRAVSAERARIEVALAALDEALQAEGDLQRQQAGDLSDSGTEVSVETVAMSVRNGLRGRLRSADRAAKRIASGTYGRSIESGVRILPARLAADPLAELTVEEQAIRDALPA